MKRRSLHGFTLVELLVVIAIIGMLVGLLLPAVQMAREAGRRSVCENNLHQLSTACSSHVQSLGFYPSGGWGSNWVGIPDYGTGLNQPGGWIYQLLPYLDQAALHDLGQGGSTTISSSASAARVTAAMPVLYCPTRRAGQSYPLGTKSPGGGPNPQQPMLTNQVLQAGRTDYAINGGTNRIEQTIVPVSVQDGNDPQHKWPSLANFNGIAAFHSQVTDAMITDNKETTYLIGEKYMSPENYVTGVDSTSTQNDPGDLFSAMSGDDVSLIRWGNDTPLNLLPSMDRTANNNPPANPSLIFGSSHGAGWHAAFCDGHVQMIAWGFWPKDPNPPPQYNNVPTTVHTYMATRNGHEVVDVTKIPK